MLNADDIKRILNLAPLPGEGGYFRETYRSVARSDSHSIATAIYYLITPESFSTLHRLPSDEIFHFYLGDPVEMLQLKPDGTGDVLVLGTDLGTGMRPQVVVPGGVWQGTRLLSGGRFALLGTTVSPGFEFRDYEPGSRTALVAQYPAFREQILALTR